MTGWRLAVAAVLVLAVGVPLALPAAELLRETGGWQAWAESGRLAELAGNTFRLVFGTLALALPAGIAGAVLLYRTDLPGRGALRFLTLLTLFVPLPLFVSAWQATLGSGGWLPLPAWSTPVAGDPDVSPTGFAWKPWARGMGAAVWIHAVAALPWVVLIVGQGLCWVEPELEEDALTAAGPGRVLWSVTLPRARAAIAAAAIWVVLQTATEISVTDMLQVRTFAEEVYRQFTAPDATDTSGLARSVAVSLPQAVAATLLVLWGAGRLERSLPALGSLAPRPLVFHLGWARWPVLGLMLLVVGILAGVPVASLVWKAGLTGSPEAWSAAVAGQHVARMFQSQGVMAAESLAGAVAAGAGTAALALVACWLAVESRWVRVLVLGLVAVIWAMPGPVIGFGLKEAINLAMRAEDAVALGTGVVTDSSALVSLRGPLRQALYYGPSPLPILWADLVRFFPCAVAVLWPVVRQLPVELRETARVEGARPRQEFGSVVVPLLAPAAGRAALAVAILALGEVSAGKVVETPGSQTFTHELFNQMHYGVTNNLAALCLVLLLLVGAGGAAVVAAYRFTAREPDQQTVQAE